MTIVDALREANTRAIKENPTTITVQRTEKVDVDGYLEEVISQRGPYTVRIFQQGMRIPQEISTLAGSKQIDKGWGLLADYNVDIKAGPNVKDEFDVPGLGHFIVIAVYPQKIQGQIVGYQADLERVD